MTLTTFAVPDPPAGEDWSYDIPGINLLAIQTIVGQFRTDLANPNEVLVKDSSPTGADLAISVIPATQHLMLGQPGALADDAATAFSNQAGTVSYAQAVSLAPSTIDFSGDYTIEWWQQIASVAQAPIPILVTLVGGDIARVDIDAGGNVQLSRGGGAPIIAPGCFLADGAWHHYVWTFDQAVQANTAFYVDGVAVAGIIVPGGWPPRGVGTVGIQLGDINPLNESGAMDEVALYPYMLSAGQVAQNFAAAAGGLAPYTQAVLGNGAVALYHLDSIATDAVRLPTLEVLNGATLLGDYPAGAPQAASTNTQYTWFADARGTPGSATPTVVTVGIPPLVMPPGFTLASLTAGIQPFDQWSGVRILWDDALQQIGPGYEAYGYPPGAFLTYKQAGG